MTPEEHRYYATQSPTSDPGERKHLLDALPRTPADLITAVSGLVLHQLFVAPLGITPHPQSADDVECRTMPNILARILARNPAPLNVARPPEQRFIGVCRDYALVACAALRHHGVPARLRVGFATYFTPRVHEDHWVCEYHTDQGWRLLDPELSPRVRAHYRMTFDPTDVPRHAFLVGGDAWLRMRRGAIAPDTCGVSSIGIAGVQFVAASVVRDLAALNKREMLAWDVWGLPRAPDLGAPIPESVAARVDAVAAVTAPRDPGWETVRDTYEHDDAFRVPAVVLSFTKRGPMEVPVDA